MATRERVEEIGNELATQHGLSGWKVAVQGHNTSPCLGCCNFDRQKLSVETYAANLCSEDEIRGIWLHEIAHALVGPDHGHDDVWHAQCQKIGGIANPSYTPEQLEQVYLNSRTMLDAILKMSAVEVAQTKNVYGPVANARNAIAAHYALKLVLGAYQHLTQGTPANAVAENIGLSTGSLAAVKAWNTIWRRKLVQRRGAS